MNEYISNHYRLEGIYTCRQSEIERLVKGSISSRPDTRLVTDLLGGQQDEMELNVRGTASVFIR